MRISWLWGILLSILMMLNGCGGGGGDPDGTAAGMSAHRPGNLRLVTAGTLEGGNMGAVDLVLELPAGVTVKKDQNGKVAPDVVQASGVNAGKSVTILTDYTAATATDRATLSVFLSTAEPAGFGLGEVGTINLDLSQEAIPLIDEIVIKKFSPVGLNGNPIPTGAGGVTAACVLTLQ